MVKKKRSSEPHGDSSSTDSSEEKVLSSPKAVGGGCPHIKKSVDTTKLRKVLKATGLTQECSQCVKTSVGSASTAPSADDAFEYDNTLWLCLKCGSQLCGRSKNQHALQHFKIPHSDSHALTMNTRSYEIWCYDCDNEVTASARKNLTDCIEIVKKNQKSPSPSQDPLNSNDEEHKTLTHSVTHKTLTKYTTMGCLPANEEEGKAMPLPPPPPPPIPGMAKRVHVAAPPPSLQLKLRPPSQQKTGVDAQPLEILPRVRGLTNLGNTCFFNAVMQCLAQTPFLLDVLKESSESGEEFILPGGTFKFNDEKDVHLPMIKGRLSSWGPLTAALAQALEELQSGGGVFTPSKLFDKLCTKCPQFRGGDQHDSHELLRHLLESVRSDDLKRYQRVILENLGYKDQDINSVSEEMRQKCKIYGNQAADRILRPEQVFRGFLVSTLTCQDCFNVSSRHEYFLDMSLPVSVESPRPPQRRRSSPDNESSSFSTRTESAGPSKAQLKKEKEKERKAKRAQKHLNKKSKQQLLLENGVPDRPDSASATGDSVESAVVYGCATRGEADACSTSSSSEQSDADVEDNLIDDATATTSVADNSRFSSLDPNGNNHSSRGATNPEKRGDSPENMDKDSLDDDDENDSGIATSPANVGSFLPSSETNGGASSDVAKSTATSNSVLAVGLSEKGAILVRQLSLVDAPTQVNGGALEDQANSKQLSSQLAKLQLAEQQAEAKKSKRVRTQSYSDWSTTIAPRYQCEDGECSIQSCLNNFTAVELMTGNNKVGCENCTRRINGSDPKAKTVNTNATKQFLVSSPPAVLILHLKRFQLGPRCIFRKLARQVSFQMVLDIAPFCGSKVKNLPNIDRKQKKLLYALYGVVEHSGGMCGGHYTAYVKVRSKLAADDKRWKFIPQGTKSELDQADEQREKLEELLVKEKARELRLKAADDSDDLSSCNSSTTSEDMEDVDAAPSSPEGAVGGDEEGRNVPMGKWYFVSDSRVQEVSENAVLKAQAYLLFYERIY